MSSTKSNVYTFFYGSSALFLLAYIIVTAFNLHYLGGWALMLFFLCLGIAVRGNYLLKGFSYTVMIFAAVSMAMYYPGYFISVGDFKFSTLMIPLLQLIMFGMGTALSFKDFANVARMPKGIIVGLICQFTIMPLTGFALAGLFNFPNEIAAGLILIGSSPSGLASNVMSYLAKANLALSVSITTVCTLVAPFTTPLLMKLLAGQYIEIDFWAMLWSITKIVIIPILAGLIFNYLLHGKFKWLDKAMPLVSMISIGIIITIIIASGRDGLLKVGGILVLAVLLHNLIGYFLGYWAARLLRFSEKDSRTLSFEIGMQNGGLASGLALTMGKVATVGLAPAIFGALMNVTGSALASWWHNKPPKEDEKSKPG